MSALREMGGVMLYLLLISTAIKEAYETKCKQ